MYLTVSNLIEKFDGFCVNCVACLPTHNRATWKRPRNECTHTLLAILASTGRVSYGSFEVTLKYAESEGLSSHEDSSHWPCADQSRIQSETSCLGNS